MKDGIGDSFLARWETYAILALAGCIRLIVRGQKAPLQSHM